MLKLMLRANKVLSFVYNIVTKLSKIFLFKYHQLKFKQVVMIDYVKQTEIITNVIFFSNSI